jgi:dihydroorotase
MTHRDPWLLAEPAQSIAPYLQIFDTHIHARDFPAEEDKETIARVLRVCKKVGVGAVGAMPNTNPPLTNYENALAYMRIAEACKSDVKFFIYLGLTNDAEQVKRVPDAIRKLEETLGYHCVLGVKQYCAHSVGNMGVLKPEDQLRNLEILAREGYTRPVVLHSEKHELMHDDLFDPQNCRTWAMLCRPPESEIKQVEQNVDIILASGFEGYVINAHTSTYESLLIIDDAKKKGMKLLAEVAPQHFRLNHTALDGEYGPYRKMNPPLREEGEEDRMLEGIRNGLVAFLGTDHAPHTLAQKTGKILDKDGKPIFMSGMTGLPRWPDHIQYLRNHGISKQRITEITHHTPKAVFGITLPEVYVTGVSCPEEYPFDSYAGLNV